MKRIALVLMVGIAMTVLAACNTQKPPEQEMADAKNALAAAKSANVDPAAYPDLKGAEDKFNAAVSEVDAQGKKLSFTRDYKGAKAMLADSKMMTDKAMAAFKAAQEKAAAEKAAAAAAAAAKKGKGKAKKK